MLSFDQGNAHIMGGELGREGAAEEVDFSIAGRAGRQQWLTQVL